MKILIVAGMPVDFSLLSYDFLIGVDYGNVNLLAQGLKPDVAVGDFDSVSPDEFEKIQKASGKLVKLPAQKDDTDLEVALDLAFEQFPNAEIQIVGALGGRMDHFLNNIFLPTTARYRQHAEQISLVDEQNAIFYLPAGRHHLQALPTMKYIGFMQLDTGDSLAIESAKYPLKAEDNFKTIYTSNEFIGQEMTVTIDKGMLIVIYTKDKK
ncbi:MULTISPECIES: thiamine diphosphokinase [unclassified Lactococcus]|uniref:thiamine diphosphokinase n=1 Tax=unclassified Lactococcus TaxID=2643510 RepID=UPI0011C8EB51|nr:MULTISPECIES: thiamine diphosphokinase [unclassified Lactococcus]MQW22050.1 thiamine diphosphokinase [Lactococcus sp. dk101]TXK44993.1 thiamine diphosphokinase [Lactococcus sp. dk310]TXK51226.1 thiamine diphosphokinase [Lactococcus sp. dk322]